MGLYEQLVDQFPNADRDLLKHYAVVNEMNSLQRMFLPVGKEVADWLGITGSQTGFSWDDMGANIAGAYFSPEEANRRGLFTHTEGDDWEGIGQGMFTEVLRKIMSREYQPTNTNVPENSGLAEYPHLQKYRN